MFKLIFSAAFFLFALIAVAKGIINSRKKHGILAIATTITTLISGVAASLLTSLVSWIAATPIVNAILDLINDAQIEGIITDVASAKGVICDLIALELASVLFLSFFLATKAILNKLVAPLLAKLILKIAGAGKKPELTESYNAFKDKGYKKFTPLSAVVSVICSVMIYFIILVPLAGTLDIVGNVGIIVAGENQMIAEISDAAANNVGTKAVMTTGGRALYSTLTTHEINGEKVSIVEESGLVAKIAVCVSTTTDEKATPEKKAAAFRDAGEYLSHTELIPMLAADFINAASDEWLADTDFHGIARPKLEAPLDNLIIRFLECTKDSTHDTMREDLKTAVELVAIIIENDVSLDEENPIIAVLANEKLTKDISFTVLSNERLYPMVTELINVSLETIGTALAAPATNEEAYNAFANDILTSLSSSAEDVSKNVGAVFKDYGIEVTEDELPSVVATLKAGVQNSTDSVKTTFAKGVGKIKFADADEFTNKYQIVTLDVLYAKGGHTDNAEAESLAMSHIMKSLSKIVEDIEAPDFQEKIEVTVADLGPLFEAMSESNVVGPDATKNLLIATLQSPLVRSILNLSLYDATDIALSISGSISERNTYSIQMVSLSNSLVMMKSASKNENSAEAVKNLLGDLTPETAESLQKLSSAEMMKTYGVAEENAENVSKFMSEMFGNMSDAKESGMPEDEYQKEADAVSDMMIIIMGNQDKENITVFGKENSMTGITVTEYVDRILGSKVMSRTIVQNVYGSSSITISNPTLNPLATGGKLTEAEKDEMVSVLDERWQARLALGLGDSYNEEYKRVLISIASMVNLEVDVNPSGHIALV